MKEFTLPKIFNWQQWRQPLSTKSTNYLGKEYLGGIIFNLYIGEDGEEHGHIVSLTETNLELQNPASIVGANSSWDGATNTSLYINSPAKTWVESLGSGWYIPAIDELNILFNNRYYVNKKLSTIVGSMILSLDTGYWSSTEQNANNSWVFYFYNGPSNITLKNSSSVVRAIKSF